MKAVSMPVQSHRQLKSNGDDAVNYTRSIHLQFSSGPANNNRLIFGATHFGGFSSSTPYTLNLTNSANSSASSTAHNVAIKNMSSIVEYLLRRSGWDTWAQFFDHSQDFDAMFKWLIVTQKQDVSFTGQKADWIRQVNYKNQAPVSDEVYIHFLLSLGQLEL